MGLTHFPNGVTSFGMPILPGGGLMTTGDVFFVDSGGDNAADDTRHGTDPNKPFSTIDYAVGQCTANNGDLIIVMPGHTETVSAAAGLDLDVAGITLVGLGSGSDRPTITFDTVVGADMDVDAANIRMFNFLFLGGVDALTGPIDVNAADFELGYCEYRDSTGQATDVIVADGNADRLYIHHYVHRGASADGGDSAILVSGTADGVRIQDFWIDGNFDTGAIEVSAVATNLTIGGGEGENYLRNRGSEDLAVNVSSATATGNIGPNINVRLADDAANITECIVGADMQIFNPIRIVNADGERHLEFNGTATVDEA